MIDPDKCTLPEGELLLRTMAMPKDTNANGDIFGGWIMSQMDIAGGILAKEVASGGRTVTIAVDSMVFLKPVKVGDVVCCYGRVLKVGNTSVRLEIEVWVRPILRETEEKCPRFKVTEAEFTFVSIDENGNKRPVSGG